MGGNTVRPHLAVSLAVLTLAAIVALPAVGADPMLENRVRILEQSIRSLTLGAPPAAVRDESATRRRIDVLTAEVQRLQTEMQVLRQRVDSLTK